jgi:hypothetical protein
VLAKFQQKKGNKITKRFSVKFFPENFLSNLLSPTKLKNSVGKFSFIFDLFLVFFHYVKSMAELFSCAKFPLGFAFI